MYVKGECMCEKGEYMYMKGECMCVKVFFPNTIKVFEKNKIIS